MHNSKSKTKSVHFSDRHIVAHGIKPQFWNDLYFYAMNVRWPTLFAVIGFVFLLVNLGFAALYSLGDGAISNQQPNNFLGAFFFSVETLATVGYGDMHPQTNYAHAIATLEIFCGMSGVALATGIIFARFSRPRSSVLFAQHPVTHNEQGQTVLLIRMANARLNVINEAKVKLRLISDEQTQHSGLFRRLNDLKLERDEHPIFALGWTIKHVIDETSPLYGQDELSLQNSKAGLILSLTGIDETTGQEVHARQYYLSTDIHWNHRYLDINHTDEQARQHIHYNDFHLTQKITS